LGKRKQLFLNSYLILLTADLTLSALKRLSMYSVEPLGNIGCLPVKDIVTP
jgi:hypothetical protein